MKVHFYGVRGSIATSGPDTVRYGGNTSCVLVEAGGEHIIFDAGTGIRQLGADLGATGVRAHLFLSHLHWDHIQGFPFFTPAFVPGNQLNVYAVHEPGDKGVRDALADQMRAPNFPVGLDVMGADMKFIDMPEHERIRIGGARVSALEVDHPNGCAAYRVDHLGKSVVYATDLEHEDGKLNHDLVEFAQNANLLIYDAMYTPEEYEGAGGPPRKGWGHSTYDAGAAVARAAGVKQLCLFHHDPSHNDGFMDGLTARAQKTFSNTITAMEGEEVSL